MNNKQSENNEKMIELLNTPVDIKDTKRDNYDVDLVPENAYTYKVDNENEDNKDEQKGLETTTTKDTIENSSADSNTLNDNILDNDSAWYYAIENYCKNGEYPCGEVYNIDKEGNLIASINIKGYSAQPTEQTDGIRILTNEEKNLIYENIKNSYKQINFLKTQEELIKEIKGFPEVNEPLLKLFDPNKTIMRFKNEKSLLSAIFSLKDNDIFRALLSIAALNKVDLFNQLIDNQVLKKDDFYAYTIDHNLLEACKTIYENMIFWVEEHSKMPTLEFLLSQVGIPYYKEIFDSYLWDEEAIKTWVDANYIRMKEEKFKYILSEINKGNIKELSNIIDSLSNIEETYKPYNDKLNDQYDDLKQYIENKENETILFTGIKPLDDKQFTIAKGKICSVFAYTGSFKTMFCTNVAYKLSSLKNNVVYFSLEIDKREMYINFLSRYSYDDYSMLSHTDIKSGNLSDFDKKLLFEELHPNFGKERKQHLIIFDETDLTSNTQSKFTQLLSNAESDFIKRTGHGVDVLIVDHVNLLKFGGEKMMNDYSAVNHWMSYFRKNTLDFLGTGKQIAILCAAQSSREGFKEATKNNGKYSLTSIAEGNEIERSSSYVLSIYTSDTDRNNNKTKMQILKCRDGSHTDDLIEVLIEPKYYAFGIRENSNNNGNTGIYTIPSNNNNGFYRPTRVI